MQLKRWMALLCALSIAAQAGFFNEEMEEAKRKYAENER